MSFDAPTPLYFEWDGEVMRPLRPKQADKEYTVGQRYRLGPVEERSMNSHNHYFAALREAWSNLQAEDAERFPTMEHLRKYALVKAGYCDERTFVLKSADEAEKLATSLLELDEFSVVDFNGNLVRLRRAKSVAKNAMPAKEFQKMKTDVLDVVAAMIGTSTAELEKHAGRAA
jgi:hypothetical protein